MSAGAASAGVLQCLECGGRYREEHAESHKCRTRDKDGRWVITDPRELAQTGVYRVGKRKWVRVVVG